MKTIESLFHPEPQQWGFRGDPFLWREMAGAFHDIPLPTSISQLALEIEHMFEKLTGQPITARESIQLERHAHGGMSSGVIAPQFWRETGVPLLISRYAQQNHCC